MSKKVFKYQIVSDTEPVTLPRGAKIILVGMQMDNVFLWALVKPYEVHDKRLFHVVPTGGNVMDYHLDHHGSFITPNGEVYHVIEMPIPCGHCLRVRCACDRLNEELRKLGASDE